MAGNREYVRLDGTGLTLVFALEAGSAADCVYLGARLPYGEDLAALAAATARGRHESQPDVPPHPGLLPECKAGWSGTPAIEIRRSGQGIASDFRLETRDIHGQQLTLAFVDSVAKARLTIQWRIASGDAITTRLTLTNTGAAPLEAERLASLALPLPARFTTMTTYAGRWAGEMREHTRAIAPDGLARQSRGGKPGFGGGNWLMLGDPTSGEVLGAHLAWSGDHWLSLETDRQGAGDGRAVLMMGASFGTGAAALAAGESITSPPAVFALAPNRSALGQSLHQYLGAEVLPTRANWGPRKVHLNSWEALGFDLSEPALMTLASDAASLGVERFVLDDGWFGGRTDDTTSLGDWTVSPDVLPGGLAPLIDHVNALGMDFGLWVEPEMVSPDSDLYRAHHDWCLHYEGRERPTMRGQLVLDLARAEVREYLFAALDALLRDNAIAYLKWDHNRDLFPAKAGQTAGLYALLDALRAAHPHVEIESCSSGGGRIDYGILSRAHRVWPSDNNDSIERARIMAAWSQFLPLEVLGNHVGPSPNPITGRRINMDFRAKIALFGHMGVEADPARMSERERDCLAAHIALYKAWRCVLHSGALWRLDHPDSGVFAQMVTHGDKALAISAQTAFSPTFDAAPVRMKGLEPQARYRVRLPEPWPRKARNYLAQPDAWRAGVILSGAALMNQGVALPLTHPETAWLIALERLPE